MCKQTLLYGTCVLLPAWDVYMHNLRLIGLLSSSQDNARWWFTLFQTPVHIVFSRLLLLKPLCLPFDVPGDVPTGIFCRARVHVQTLSSHLCTCMNRPTLNCKIWCVSETFTASISVEGPCLHALWKSCFTWTLGGVSWVTQALFFLARINITHMFVPWVQIETS